MRKLFASLVIGLLVLGLAPVFIMNAYAQITITNGDVLSIDSGGKEHKDGDPLIYKINPDTGATISSVEITLDASFSGDLTVTGGTGIAFNPDDGKIYVLLKTSTEPGDDAGKDRVLATVDPLTGIATLVGDTGKTNIASLTFNPGTLFSVDRDFEGLSTISTVDGSVVNLCGLVDENGNGLARNSNDGLLYFVTDDEYQRIDDFGVGMSNPCDVTDISVSGFLDIPGPLLFIPTENHFLVGLDQGSELWSLTTTDGADLDFLGFFDHKSRGLTLIENIIVGGELLPIDSTALMLAGLQTSAIWMLPILAGAAGIGAYYIKTRMNKE